MEPAGIAVGLLGLTWLFSSCLAAVERVRWYKSFESDSKSLDARHNDARLQFAKWGQAVSFNHESLTVKHHPLARR
jgi:ASC-1-like (ASCH) protein